MEGPQHGDGCGDAAGAGAERTAGGMPGSEYGLVPFVGYVSLTAFF